MIPKPFDWMAYAVNTVVTSVIYSGIELGSRTVRKLPTGWQCPNISRLPFYELCNN
jgi:hypothetical protein